MIISIILSLILRTPIGPLFILVDFPFIFVLINFLFEFTLVHLTFVLVLVCFVMLLSGRAYLINIAYIKEFNLIYLTI